MRPSHPSSQALATLFKSWPGILYLCKDDFQNVRRLVRALTLQNEDIARATLDLFFEVLRLPMPAWSTDLATGA